MQTNTSAVSFRERHHSTIWSLLWPVRAWFTGSPFHRGKGLIYRHVILPSLPPRPASFVYCLPHGETIDLSYREDLGTEVLLHGRYEDREIAELCRHIVPSGTVFDVGANIGLSALEFARTVGAAGQVIAFEPHPKTAERLRINLERNDASNVRIIQAAVGSEPGTITFNESSDPTLSSATIVPRNMVRSFEVALTTVDIAWTEAGKPLVSVLKIDVEGGELAALQGASELLARDYPAILLEAWGADQLGPIHNLLLEAGYEQHQPDGFESRNYLYLKREASS